MKVLVTGCYGFIGSHVCANLLAKGHEVLGTDRIIGAISEKAERITAIAAAGSMRFEDIDLGDYDRVDALVGEFQPDVVIHLAAQFPIKHTRDAVRRYVASNVTGWLSVAEACRTHRVPRMVYASSVTARDKPSSLYGATKRFNELLAYTYASQFGMTVIGLRYAAVYGPAIRRDAAVFRVARDLVGGHPLAAGRGFRSPTHMVEISEAAECTARLAEADGVKGSPVFLIAADDEKATMGHVAEVLARELGIVTMIPDHGPRTGRPDLAELRDAIGFVPTITMEIGMKKFALWLKDDQ